MQIVARELALHSNLDEGGVMKALHGALEHLMSRAHRAITADPESKRSVRYARQYQAVSEAVLFLGTRIIALEDIGDEEETDGDAGCEHDQEYGN